MAQRKTDSPIVVDGIKLSIAPEDTEDALLLELMVDANDESLSDEERGEAAWQANRRLFGRREWKRILSELAEKKGVDKGDGTKRLPPGVVRDFVDEATAAVNRKNSEG